MGLFLLYLIYYFRNIVSLFLISFKKTSCAWVVILIHYGEKNDFYPCVRHSLVVFDHVNMINKFRHGISFSSTSRERDVLIESIVQVMKEKMWILSAALYFYTHLPIIYDMGVLVHFTSIKIEFLTAVNVAPYQITPNIWGILKAF